MMRPRKSVHLLDEYDASHRHPVNRALHVAGIPVVMLSIVGLLAPWRPFGLSRQMMLGSFIGGWVLLFVGHAIEGNRPAILKNPTAAISGLLWWGRGCVSAIRAPKG